MLKANPQLQLETLFCLNSAGRIVSTREPHPAAGPAFMLIRGAAACAWAVRADLDDALLDSVGNLAAQEPASTMWDRPPVYADRYQQLLGGSVSFGPAFEFPEAVQFGPDEGSISNVDNEKLLDNHFSGWIAGEIAAGRSPVMAVSEGGYPVSICFSARRSTFAAEAGVETAKPFRRRGYAVRATAAWADAIKTRGLIPLYSTDWDNQSSLAVARKLQLIPFASDYSIA